MTPPDPEGMSILAKVMAAGAAIVAPVWIARTWLEKRFEHKIDKDEFSDFITRFDQHTRDDRETQAKLFDKIDDLKSIMLDRLP